MGTYSTTLREGLIGLYRRVLYRYDKSTGEYCKRYEPPYCVVRDRVGKSLSVFARYTSRSFECPLGMERFPELYSGAKRTLYRRAVDSLRREPLRERDAVVTAFVKVESTRIGSDPRVIQARSPRFHVMYGRYIKPIEKLCYQGVDRVFGEKTIVKGMNGEEIGGLIVAKFRSFCRPVAIGLDASRFDRSVSVPVLSTLFHYYRALIGNNSEFDEMLKWQIVNEGRMYTPEGRIGYTVAGGVMSGDMDTSLKGCILMCAMVYAWATHVGCEVKLINNGDDCVVFMEAKDEARFRRGLSQYFAELGFDIVAELTALHIEHIEFCQARPVLDSRGMYVMCRDPLKATSKDSLARVGMGSEVEYRRWLRAVGECGMALAGDMPIFGSYYQRYLHFAGDVKVGGLMEHGGYANGLLYASRGMCARYGVTDDTRLSFWAAWGIKPHTQRMIEDYYEALDMKYTISDPSDSEPQIYYQAPYTLQSISKRDGSKTSGQK